MTLVSKQDRDRLRQSAAATRRTDKKVAETARRIVREHLEQGRPAQACLADLIQAAKGLR